MRWSSFAPFAAWGIRLVRIRFLQTESFRLSAIYALVFALSVLAIGTAMLALTRQALREQILQSAQTDIVAMQRAYRQEGIAEVREVVGQLKGAPGASEYFLVQQNGKRLAGNLPPMSPDVGNVELPQGAGHAAVLGVGAKIAPDLYAFSGTTIARVQEVQSQILRMLLWVFLGALILAIAGGFLISRSFLNRTDSMTKACRAIMEGNLKTRLPLRGVDDELDRLAATVNEMLDRIAALMANLGQVTNDIAHDLRTPITHLRHRLERGKTECSSPAEYNAAMDAAIEKTDEILGMFAALLRIVQIEAGSRRAAFTRLELTALIEQLREVYTSVAEEADHTLTVDATTEAAINGDRALLVQLFSNLIENAIIHTPPGTHIWLRLSRADPGRVAVTVADNGPGVRPEEHSRIFQRLYRREASRSAPGHGLGLSLVAAIAELHGAQVEIEPVEPGLSVRVAFATSFQMRPGDGLVNAYPDDAFS